MMNIFHELTEYIKFVEEEAMVLVAKIVRYQVRKKDHSEEKKKAGAGRNQETANG